MPINVGDLLKERDRLLMVIEEAKIARSRIRQINVLVTMYGDDEKVTVKPAHAVTGAMGAMVKCPKCGKEVKKQGLGVHNRQMHSKRTAAQRRAAAVKGNKARTLRSVS